MNKIYNAIKMKILLLLIIGIISCWAQVWSDSDLEIKPPIEANFRTTNESVITIFDGFADPISSSLYFLSQYRTPSTSFAIIKTDFDLKYKKIIEIQNDPLQGTFYLSDDYQFIYLGNGDQENIMKINASSLEIYQTFSISGVTFNDDAKLFVIEEAIFVSSNSTEESIWRIIESTPSAVWFGQGSTYENNFYPLSQDRLVFGTYVSGSDYYFISYDISSPIILWKKSIKSNYIMYSGLSRSLGIKNNNYISTVIVVNDNFVYNTINSTSGELICPGAMMNGGSNRVWDLQETQGKILKNNELDKYLKYKIKNKA